MRCLCSATRLEEARQLPLLAREIGVQQRLVALAPAPQHVVRAPQPLRGLQHQAHLGGGEGEDLRVGVGGGTGGVARVAEQVGGAPQQPRAGLLHALADALHHRIQVGLGLGEGRALGRDVAVMEREERRSQLADELEGGIDLGGGALHRVDAGAQPGPIEGACPEDVGAGPVEGMPQADRHPQLLVHAPPADQAVGLVDLEGKGIVRSKATEGDRSGDIGKELAWHAPLLRRAQDPALRA